MTVTIETELEALPWETPALLLTFPEGAPTTPAGTDLLTDARAEARSWSPNTRRAFVPEWKHFTNWRFENRCTVLPGVPVDVGSCLEHLMETEGRTMATARMRLAVSMAPINWARQEAAINLRLGSRAAVQERVARFLAGLSSRKDKVMRRCRTVLQSMTDELLGDSRPNFQHAADAHST